LSLCQPFRYAGCANAISGLNTMFSGEKNHCIHCLCLCWLRNCFLFQRCIMLFSPCNVHLYFELLKQLSNDRFCFSERSIAASPKVYDGCNRSMIVRVP